MLIRLGIYAAVAVAAVAWAFALGNRHGPNAQRYAAVLAELEATNKEINILKAQDARVAAHEKRTEAEQDAVFAQASKTIGKCELTADQAAALNRIGGG
mgnify:CR=1 FL=1